jgi:hypothetical protein
MHSNVQGGILTATMHPQVIGRAHRITMLSQFIDNCLLTGDVTFARMGDVVKTL